MKFSRRQFLVGLMAAGATIALPVPIAQATPAQINTAWKKLLHDPWMFSVDECGTIVDPSIGEPTVRSDVFDANLGPLCTPQSLVDDIENCMPLTSHFQQLAIDELEEVTCSLEEDESLNPAARQRLKRLAKALDDELQGWSEWVLLEGAEGLPRFKGEVEKWLASPIEWADYEWFPRYSTAQGSAMGFFEELPTETLDALGVVIVEGDHPGSTYFAAELRKDVDAANTAAQSLGLPFRFRAGVV